MELNGDMSYDDKYSMLNDRVNEIKGHLNTLDFAFEIDKIDARLYRMRRKTFMYELELIDTKLGQMRHDKELAELLNNLKLNEI